VSAVARRNSPLLVFGNPGKDAFSADALAQREADRAKRATAPSGAHIYGVKPEALSERAAWMRVSGFAQDMDSNAGITHTVGSLRAELRRYAIELRRMARVMLEQLDSGVHKNPRGRVKVASHVQAIAYVHAKDGDKYVHGFGDADLNESELKRGVLKLDSLKDRTHVEAYGNADGTVTLCPTRGQALVGFFPD
jgi:hypothetical protein